MLYSLLSVAIAAETPVWAWPVGQPVRYHIESAVYVPRGVYLYALNNDDAASGVVQIQADTTCTAAMEGKVTVVTCTFEHLKVSASPIIPKEAEELKGITAEWVARLTPVRVIFRQGKDGRMREFDVEGLDRPDARAGAVNDTMRSYLQRAFALFDLSLPAAGDDWVRGWDLTTVTPVLYLPGGTGTMGSGRIKFTPKGAEDGLYSILYGGKATLTEGSQVDQGTSVVYDTRVAGSIQWDLARGTPAWRDLSMEAYRTASTSETGSGATYAIVGALQRVEAFNADGSAPLSLSAERAPKLGNPPPELEDGFPLVAFADLGMEKLYVPSMPAEARSLQLDKATMKARVTVEADGRVRTATVYEGYQTLVASTEQALKAARFAVHAAAAYTVDVEVEFRQE